MFDINKFENINDSFNNLKKIKNYDRINITYTIKNPIDIIDRFNIRTNLAFAIYLLIYFIKESELFDKWYYLIDNFFNKKINLFVIDVSIYNFYFIRKNNHLMLYAENNEGSTIETYTSEMFAFSALQQLIANEFHMSIGEMSYSCKNLILNEKIKKLYKYNSITFDWSKLNINNEDFKTFVHLGEKIKNIKTIEELIKTVNNISIKYETIVNMTYILIHHKLKELLFTNTVKVRHYDCILKSKLYNFCDKNIKEYAEETCFYKRGDC